jgi:hypothetical protein
MFRCAELLQGSSRNLLLTLLSGWVRVFSSQVNSDVAAEAT